MSLAISLLQKKIEPTPRSEPTNMGGLAIVTVHGVTKCTEKPDSNQTDSSTFDTILTDSDVYPPRLLPGGIHT